MALSEAEQREMLDLLRQQAGYRRVSRSPLRHVGEGATETISGFAWNTDGSVHVLLVKMLAELGDPDALNLLREVARLDPARHPDRAHDRLLAQAILNSLDGVKPVESAAPTGVTPGMVVDPVVSVPPPAAAVAYVPPPPPPPAPVPYTPPATAEVDPPPSVGRDIGKAYDALRQLGLADALPIEERAPLAALISVLQTKNGSNI